MLIVNQVVAILMLFKGNWSYVCVSWHTNKKQDKEEFFWSIDLLTALYLNNILPPFLLNFEETISIPFNQPEESVTFR